MTAYLPPFADELLTSWHARRRIYEGGPRQLATKAALDRNGDWRHPDIRPTIGWLKAASAQLDVPVAVLKECALARRYPALPLDFAAWDFALFVGRPDELRPAPKLRISWCTRCLAEDYASGRPAYVRQHWVLAATGFCHAHNWPLQDMCSGCGAGQWRFANPARGPLRLLCLGCWRPLERALPATLACQPAAQECWDCVIAFEAELLSAVQGRTPNQFRFNFTSANQLINAVRDICRLLTRRRPTHARSEIALNRFINPNLSPDRMPVDCPPIDATFPLATASLTQRRALLAAAAAIIDPLPSVGKTLFGQDSGVAIDTFVASVEGSALNLCLSRTKKWSPSFCSRITAALRCRRREKLSLRLTDQMQRFRLCDDPPDAFRSPCQAATRGWLTQVSRQPGGDVAQA